MVGCWSCAGVVLSGQVAEFLRDAAVTVEGLIGMVEGGDHRGIKALLLQGQRHGEKASRAGGGRRGWGCSHWGPNQERERRSLGCGGDGSGLTAG